MVADSASPMVVMEELDVGASGHSDVAVLSRSDEGEAFATMLVEREEEEMA